MSSAEEVDDLVEEVEYAWPDLQVDVDEDGIAKLVVNRPDALNALNAEVVGQLRAAIEELALDDAVRAIVVTGSGEKAFVAGADIAEMSEYDALEARSFSHFGQDMLSAIEACPKLVVAMIQGYALGGGLELALACHLRVASTSAQLGLPEVGLGLIPGFGGTQRLLRIAGPSVAREWILTGDQFPASEALRVGVVNRVVEPEALWDEVRGLALKVASRGPVAVQAALETIRRGLEVGQSEGESLEADSFGMMFSTRDMKEGVQAFLEKRKPEFEGH
ncbi:MAG TPA: crotonase [Planctomycetes bacterium]|nr:crotonase [Planctomycetota bacterium]|tara:strand:+ start:26 stop:856 length:831 start_codon:yes stop_codon:yes gene_type:complete